MNHKRKPKGRMAVLLRGRNPLHEPPSNGFRIILERGKIADDLVYKFSENCTCSTGADDRTAYDTILFRQIVPFAGDKMAAHPYEGVHSLRATLFSRSYLEFRPWTRIPNNRNIGTTPPPC